MPDRDKKSKMVSVWLGGFLTLLIVSMLHSLAVPHLHWEVIGHYYDRVSYKKITICFHGSKRQWGKGEGSVKVAAEVGLPRWCSGKESPANTSSAGVIPGWGRFSAEGNGNPLQYSCLKNPMDRRAWQAIVHGLQRVGHDWVHTQQLKYFLLSLHF